MDNLPLNRLLAEFAASDSEGRERLAPLSGVSLDIACSLPPFELGIRVDEGGVLQLCQAGGAQVRVRGTATQLLAALQGNTTGLRIDGDMEQAQALFKVLRKLNPDMLFVLERAIGDGPARTLHGLAGDMQRDIAGLGAVLGRSLERAGVSAEAFSAWVDGVASMRLALDRLEAGISSLESGS